VIGSGTAAERLSPGDAGLRIAGELAELLPVAPSDQPTG